MQEKERVFFAVCSAILKLEVEKGHLAWTLSDISRVSNITRSLIYYYFGKEKETILHEAYRFIIDTFFDLSPEKSKATSVPERMKDVLEKVQLMPYLFVLYYLEKGRDTEIGQMLRHAEAETIKNLRAGYPHLTELECLDLYMRELGAIALHLAPDKAEEVFAAYKK